MQNEIRDMNAFEAKLDRLVTVGLWMQTQLPADETYLETSTITSFLEEIVVLEHSLQHVIHDFPKGRGEKIRDQLNWLGFFTLALSDLFCPSTSRLRLNTLHAVKAFVKYKQDVVEAIDFQIKIISKRVIKLEQTEGETTE